MSLWLLTASLADCDVSQLNLQSELQNVSYALHDETKLDVYLPNEGNGPFPTVLLVHGTDVDKSYFQGTSTIDDLTTHGYAAISVEYRPPTASEPLISLSDISCALGWTYANKDVYHFNTHTIVALGHSRGASLVTLLAARSDISTFLAGCSYTLPDKNWIHGIVAYAGSFGTPAASFSDPFFVNTFSTALNLSKTETTDIFAKLSELPPSNWLSSDELPASLRQYVSFFPIAWIDGTEPPFLLIQGENDELVSPRESPAFAEVLRNAGVTVELLIVPNGSHRLNQSAIHDQLFAFLSEVQG